MSGATLPPRGLYWDRLCLLLRLCRCRRLQAYRCLCQAHYLQVCRLPCLLRLAKVRLLHCQPPCLRLLAFLRVCRGLSHRLLASLQAYRRLSRHLLAYLRLLASHPAFLHRCRNHSRRQRLRHCQVACLFHCPQAFRVLCHLPCQSQHHQACLQVRQFLNRCPSALALAFHLVCQNLPHRLLLQVYRPVSRRQPPPHYLQARLLARLIASAPLRQCPSARLQACPQAYQFQFLPVCLNLCRRVFPAHCPRLFRAVFRLRYLRACLNLCRQVCLFRHQPQPACRSLRHQVSLSSVIKLGYEWAFIRHNPQ